MPRTRLAAAGLLFFSAQTAHATSVAVSVDAGAPLGTSKTTLSTQLPYPHALEETAEGQAWLDKYAPPLCRIHAGADGTDPHVDIALPEWIEGQWDFTPMNTLVNNVRRYGGEPVMNIRFALQWMWTCSSFGGSGDLKDKTYAQFAGYIARLVSY